MAPGGGCRGSGLVCAASPPDRASANLAPRSGCRAPGPAGAACAAAPGPPPARLRSGSSPIWVTRGAAAGRAGASTAGGRCGVCARCAGAGAGAGAAAPGGAAGLCAHSAHMSAQPQHRMRAAEQVPPAAKKRWAIAARQL
jgi:hypothetical protein